MTGISRLHPFAVALADVVALGVLVLGLTGANADAAPPSDAVVDASALHHDAETCDVAALRAALAVGTGMAQLDAADAQGRTPLAVAARGGCLVAVSTLVRAGANLERIDVAGWTAMHHAASQRHAEVVDYLLAHGAAQEPRTLRGETPLALVLAGSREQFGPPGDRHTTEMVLLSGHPREKIGATAKAPVKSVIRPDRKRKSRSKPAPKPAPKSAAKPAAKPAARPAAKPNQAV